MNDSNLFLNLYQFGGIGFGKALAEFSTSTDIANLGMAAPQFNTEVTLSPIGDHVRDLDLQTVNFTKRLNDLATEQILTIQRPFRPRLSEDNRIRLDQEPWKSNHHRVILAGFKYKGRHVKVEQMRFFSCFQAQLGSCFESIVIRKIYPSLLSYEDPENMVYEHDPYVVTVEHCHWEMLYDWTQNQNKMEREFKTKENAEAFAQKVLDLRKQQMESGRLAPFIGWEIRKPVITLPPRLPLQYL